MKESCFSRTRALAIVFVGAWFLSGCGSQPTKPDTEKSIALQIMEAAGKAAGLRDVDRPAVESALGEKTESDASWAYLGDAALHATKLVAPPPGFSPGGATAMALLGLFPTNTSRDADVSQLIVWMPQTEAPDAERAQERMGLLLEKAAIDALPAGYEAKPFEWTDVAVFGAKSKYRVIKVNGPSCPQWSCVIQGAEGSLRWKMHRSTAPAIVPGGPYPAWSYTGWASIDIEQITNEYDETGSINGHWHRIETVPLVGYFKRNEWYIRISENLPEWAYYYHTPSKRYPEYSPFPAPVVLHQGKPLLFVRPEPGTSSVRRTISPTSSSKVQRALPEGRSEEVTGP